MESSYSVIDKTSDVGFGPGYVFPYISTNSPKYLLFFTMAELLPHYIRKGGVSHDRLQPALEHLKVKRHQPVPPDPQLSFQLRPAPSDP